MTEIWLFLGALSLAIWLYLLVARGGYWLARERNDCEHSVPAAWPSVVAIVPARDEADVIARALASLLAQDYPGPFRIVMVDDQSSDGTGDIARALGSGFRLETIAAPPRPSGWTGKLWAAAQGIAHAKMSGASDFIWLTDADIAHEPENLRALVTRAERDGYVLVSEMVRLHCTTPAERFLIPAFVYFFDMLYPFAWVNTAERGTAAAAGGSMLARSSALDAAGGIEAIRGEIIDDCALARRMKKQGPIWLGLTQLAESIRPYAGAAEIGRMVSRSAYAQLGYSFLALFGTILGMALMYVVPPAAALGSSGSARIAGLLAWLAMAVSFQPMLRFYRVSPLWGFAFPVIGMVYTGFTLQSAVQFWNGRGGMWKGRVQAMTNT